MALGLGPWALGLGPWAFGLWLLLRRVVAVAGAHLRLVFNALYFQTNRTKLSIAHFVRRIVSKTIKRTNIGGHARERGFCIRQICRHKTSAARRTRQIVHFTPR